MVTEWAGGRHEKVCLPVVNIFNTKMQGFIDDFVFYCIFIVILRNSKWKKREKSPVEPVDNLGSKISLKLLYLALFQR